jgi:hypothetical protein
LYGPEKGSLACLERSFLKDPARHLIFLPAPQAHLPLLFHQLNNFILYQKCYLVSSLHNTPITLITLSIPKSTFIMFDFNDSSLPLPRSCAPCKPVNHASNRPLESRIHLSAVSGTYRVYVFHMHLMLHMTGEQGKIAGKFNSDTGSGYFVSDGQGEDLGANEWIDFTWFGERSSIRSVRERRRVKELRENRGLMARVERGYGSLQFTRKAGVIEASVIFHGQGKGMDEWFRGPKLITSYGVSPIFIYKRRLMELQQRWNYQPDLYRPRPHEDEDEEDIWESDDESVVDRDAMDWEIIGARKDCRFLNRSGHVSASCQSNGRKGYRTMKGWVAKISSKELSELKELKKWEESKTRDELDRLRHLKAWAERNGLAGVKNEAESGAGIMGRYLVSNAY